MMYMGGKAALARDIAQRIEEHRRGRPVWEPFCGALNVTAALSCPRGASDIHPGLIALYQLLQGNPSALDGLSRVTEEEYAYARTLSDDNPLKAIIGFGCSFGGKWFGGFARGDGRDWAGNALSALKNRIAQCAGVDFACASFFDVPPTSNWCVYADPPYAGTSRYRDTFDYPAFISRVREWAVAGSTVLVSEYDFPLGQEVWSVDRAPTLGAGYNGTLTRKADRLFLVEGS